MIKSESVSESDREERTFLIYWCFICVGVTVYELRISSVFLFMPMCVYVHLHVFRDICTQNAAAEKSHD